MIRENVSSGEEELEPSFFSLFRTIPEVLSASILVDVLAIKPVLM